MQFGIAVPRPNNQIQIHTPKGSMECNPSALAAQIYVGGSLDYFVCKICQRKQNRDQFSEYFKVLPDSQRRCKTCTAAARRRAARLCFRTTPELPETYTLFDAVRYGACGLHCLPGFVVIADCFIYAAVCIFASSRCVLSYHSHVIFCAGMRTLGS